MNSNDTAKWQWFTEGRFGMFIHWGPYAQIGRGEQVLFREHLDHHEYAQAACKWNPQNYDPHRWAAIAKQAGCKYATLTTRHHDGYCLWDSQYTDYSSARQAPQRDFVDEYVKAFHAAGLKVGLYYSLLDWRIPALFGRGERDPQGMTDFVRYVHNQVRELLSNYGPIDVFWFDGAWPLNAQQWQAPELIKMIRELQPSILINNRLDIQVADDDATPEELAGASAELGDFGTPEHHISPDRRRPWESCQVSTWRLWCHTFGERWRPADVLLDFVCEAASKGGNLLLNVGPTADGEFPEPFIDRMTKIGQWFDVHGEAIYGTSRGNVTEFVTRGWQTVKGNTLYLIIRFWDGSVTFRVWGLASKVTRATLLTTGHDLRIEQAGDELKLHGLPTESPTDLFPVIRLECDGPPQPIELAGERLWARHPEKWIDWAAQRGTSVWTDGKPRA